MKLLLKITSEPLQMVRSTQNARLVSSASMDIERRKALARQMSFRRSNASGQGGMALDDIRKINTAFSRSHAASQLSEAPQQQVVRPPQMAKQQIARQPKPQYSAPVSSASSQMTAANGTATAETVPVVPVSSAPVTAEPANISTETNSSYAAQRGAFEMRVAKGELTYLPPLVMTIITQRPQVHIEYLGDFNYVPPRDSDPGSYINLFT